MQSEGTSVRSHSVVLSPGTGHAATACCDTRSHTTTRTRITNHTRRQFEFCWHNPTPLQGLSVSISSQKLDENNSSSNGAVLTKLSLEGKNIIKPLGENRVHTNGTNDEDTISSCLAGPDISVSESISTAPSSDSGNCKLEETGALTLLTLCDCW
jgi:hypothetical protein